MGSITYHKQKSHEHWERNKLDPEWLAKRSEYASNRRRYKKSQAVQRFGSLCAHCGGNYPDCVFEFHHRNHDEKDVTPAKLFMLKDDTINNELDKCIMLCANCHRIQHLRDEYNAHSKRNLDYLGKKYGSK